MTMSLLLGHCLFAQVTIGGPADPKKGTILDLNSMIKGGLLLSNISIPDLSKIPANTFAGISQAKDTDYDLAGMIVYNTNEYTGTGIYLWDGENWNRIALEGSITIKGNAGNREPFPADGSSENGYIISNPLNKQSGNYTFTWISGERYIERFYIIDPGNGRFSVKFSKNDQASPRHAILLVTAPDGKTATFVFTQEGDTAGCGVTSNIPDIKAEYFNTLCAGGAVYLYLENRPATGVFIWTLNGEEVGRGTQYAATKPGVYTVYADKIGCTSTPSKFVHVYWSGSTAPSPVRIKNIENNGEICGNNTVGITVSGAPAGANIYWHKDGVRQPAFTGQTIQVREEGVWQAVVVDGACTSVFSDAAVITKNPASPLPKPNMIINGDKNNSNWKLCRGSSAHLEVDNPDPYYTYTWYADDALIGTGSDIFFSVPSQNSVLIRLRVSGNGCASETSYSLSIGNSYAPTTPVILGNSALCGGRTVLTAITSSPVASPEFTWYRDGVEIGKGNTITVDRAGRYNVAVKDGSSSCMSLPSATKEVVWSDFAELSWVLKPESAKHGDIKVYKVSATNTPVSYNWTVVQSGIGDITSQVISSGQGTDCIVVNFPVSGSNVNISVSGTNNCGDALNNSRMTVNVNLGNSCPMPKIISPSSSQKIDKEIGEYVELRVDAVDIAASHEYEWVEGGQRTVQKGADPFYRFQASNIGTTQYYCVVRNKCDNGNKEDTSPVFTVNIKQNPQNLPKGNGNLTGRTCFDIVSSNFDSECGERQERERIKADFTKQSTREQTYTFTSSGTVKNLHFVVTGAVEYLDSSKPQPYEVSGQTIKLYFRSDLNSNSSIIGRKGENAAEITVYAIYNDNSGEVAVPLTIKIQDCTCCRAKISPTEWRAFMCYNLGVNVPQNTYLDPFTPTKELIGNFYKFGNTTPVTASNWNRVQASSSLWSKDPCPNGWHIPTKAEWEGIKANNENALKATGNWYSIAGSQLKNLDTEAGFYVGSSLFFPAGGIYHDGYKYWTGASTDYWIGDTYNFATQIDDQKNQNQLEFKIYETNTSGPFSLGLNIRCIANK
jgi:uncharacterized protein (TIGR02145 family)